MTNDDQNLLDLITNPNPSDDLSFWHYLHSRANGPAVALVYAKAFWPDFILVKDFVFLKENYDAEYFDRVTRDCDPALVEATINTTYLPDLFGAQDVDDNVWQSLGEILCETWRARATFCFPERHFKAQFSWYSNGGDPGLTIHQTKYRGS